MKYYLVYRQYSSKEQRFHSDPFVFYGWTQSKDVIKAFKSQRSEDKYMITKTDSTELGELLGSNASPPEETMIDYVPLKMASTKEVVNFFTTHNEMQNIEKWIQRLFRESSKLVDRDNGKTRLLELYLNLDEWYKGALEFLGFIPPELEAIFDSVDFHENSESEYELERRITDAYDGYLDWPQEDQVHDTRIPGLQNMPHIHNKIIYSLESFVKAAKDDL